MIEPITAGFEPVVPELPDHERASASLPSPLPQAERPAAGQPDAPERPRPPALTIHEVARPDAVHPVAPDPVHQADRPVAVAPSPLSAPSYPTPSVAPVTGVDRPTPALPDVVKTERPRAPAREPRPMDGPATARSHWYVD